MIQPFMESSFVCIKGIKVMAYLLEIPSLVFFPLKEFLLQKIYLHL